MLQFETMTTSFNSVLQVLTLQFNHLNVNSLPLYLIVTKKTTKSMNG